MDRIIISFSELSRNSWTSIYTLIKGIQEHNVITPTQNKNLKVSIKESQSQEPQKDICSIDEGKLLSEQKLLVTSKDQRVFNLIYVKQSESEDFSRLVHFFLLKKEYGRQITLGIDVSNVESSESNSYYFKCSGFFTCIEDKRPLIGDKSIYFIFNKVNENTGELRLVSQKLAGKGDKVLVGNESRRFLPLLKINRQNFYELFLHKSIDQPKSKEAEYIKNSIDKISKELFSIDTEVYHSIFDEWFTKAYFYSLGNHKIGDKWAHNKKIISVLHSYYHNIFEIVQNIIYHGNGQGLLYCAFSRKENLSEDQGLKIVNFDGYDSDERFLEIGVFDYGKIGIVENYLQSTDLMLVNESEERRQQWAKDKNDISLETFFDIHSILTIGITRTDLRYAANMGLKSFVNSLMRHNGYFRVESNSSKGAGLKDVVETVLGKTSKTIVQTQESAIFTDGTHYEVILPVRIVANDYSTTTQYATQYGSLAELLVKGQNTITEIPLYSVFQGLSNNLWESSNKEEQRKLIKEIGDFIIREIQIRTNNQIIALSLNGLSIGVTYVFKLLAYIQFHLQAKQLLILTQLEDCILDGVCDQIRQLLNDSEPVQIWNNNAPVILISEKLRFQILCGETKSDFLYVNGLINNRYPNQNSFEDIKREHTINPSNHFIKIANSLVSNLYEFNIVDEKGISIFERFIYRILKQPIEGKDIGYCVNHEYTQIGSKIIIKNFYEADTLFQNTFYSERFAFLIAKNIIETNCIANTKDIVLIGYKSYSQSLVKYIKKFLNYKYNKSSKGIIVNYIIANEDENGLTWKIHNDNIIHNASNYRFITIVPIGSTLSIHSKVIALLQKQVDQSQEVINIYNHCAIVVRDRIMNNMSETVTEEERKHKWKTVDVQNKIIETELYNIPEVHYTIQIAASDNDSNWYSLLDKRFFPINAWNEKSKEREKYINDTHNSSLNSQNLMGYPRVIDVDVEQYNKELEHIKCLYKNHSEEYVKAEQQIRAFKEQEKQYKIELARLKTFEEYIHYGHIERYKSHFRNYFDTEKYIREEVMSPSATLDDESLLSWISTLKKYSNIFDPNVFNILITPTIDIEPEFVEIINEKLFNNAALIIHVDIQNWRSNIIHKYSYINDITKDREVNYHFIDHVLLTGECYRNAKSYMRSILKYHNYEKFHFKSIITLINRLSYDRNREIADEIEGNVFSYLHLFIPHSSNPDRDCSLCKLEEYYSELRSKTIVDSCLQTIKGNIGKIKLGKFERNVYCNPHFKNEIKRKRAFKRLCLTHMIFYRISQIFKRDKCIENQKVIMGDILNRIYQYEDDKISFIKVISSPPLSQYIYIRNYAHEKLIDELHKVFKLVDTDTVPTYEDYCKMCVILKQLSFLKSNALVRKDVIANAWKLSIRLQVEGERIKEQIIDKEGEIKEKLENKLKQLNLEKVVNFKHKFHFFIKNAIFADDAKSRFLGDLLRTGVEQVENPIIKRTKLSPSETNELFNDIPSYLYDLYGTTDNEGYKILKQQYIDFLVWLFYDNTTIIQKTLQNFNSEINKSENSEFYKCFYNNNRNLKDCDAFISDLQMYKSAFTKKVESEYYYSSFKPYLANEDQIDFVEKILYVLFAKLKLKEINKEHKPINEELLSLLQIFAKIMGADTAFFSMKHVINGDNVVCYPMAIFNDFKNNWDYNSWNFNKFFTSKVLMQEDSFKRINYPMIIIKDKKHKYGETYEQGLTKPSGKYINVLVLHDDQKYDNIIATITFVYSENANKEKLVKHQHKINSQEYGRLLLLLKNEINQYVNNYLKDEKIFNLWVERHKSDLKFRKVYLESNHSFMMRGISENLDFDTLDIDNLIKIKESYKSHTDKIINHMYASIIVCDGNRKLSLNIQSSENEINRIIDEKFQELLMSFDNKHGQEWKGELSIESTHLNTTTTFHKQVLRAFILQCLDNSLRKHCYGNRLVKLKITETHVEIVAQKYNDDRLNSMLLEEGREYNKIKRELIKRLDCSDYERKTHTAIQAYCDKYHFECDFSFDEMTYDFIVKIGLIKKV